MASWGEKLTLFKKRTNSGQIILKKYDKGLLTTKSEKNSVLKCIQKDDVITRTKKCGGFS